MRLPAAAIAGRNSCPRRLAGEAVSTGAGLDHRGVPPENDRFDITIREYPVGVAPHDPWRSAQMAWKAVPSNVMKGCVVVRKLADVVPCVKEQMLARTVAFPNDRPSSSEIADMMASDCFDVGFAKRRQTRTTVRVA